MIASACSLFNLSQSCLKHTLFLKQRRKHPFLLLATKILIFILCYHAFFHHNAENLAEIEEEEPELVIVISPGIKRNAKKEYT